MTNDNEPVKARDVIARLECLRKNQTIIYNTARSMWLSSREMAGLRQWLTEVNKKGLYDFTQRKMEDGYYQYIARRRVVPAPEYKV